MSQQLVRNSTVAQSILRGMTDMVVGSGPVFDANTADPEWNAKAEALFSAWWHASKPTDGPDFCGHLDGPALVQSVFRQVLVDGDVLVLPIEGALGVQVIDADRVRSLRVFGRPMMSRQADNDEETAWVNGVLVDEAGRPLAYRVCEYWDFSSGVNDSAAVEIDAHAAWMITSPHMRRAGQVRGEPVMAAIAPAVDQLDEIAESVRMAYRVAAAAAMIIPHEFPDAMKDILGKAQSGGGVDGDNPYDGRDGGFHQTEMAPGTIMYVPPGSTPTQFKPEQPSANYENLVLHELSRIGAAIGLPLVLLLADFRQVNFHSARSAIVMAWRTIKTYQRCMEHALVRPMARRFLAEMVARGELEPRDDWDKHDWVWPGQPVIDPKAQMEMYEKGAALGLMTDKLMLSQLGDEVDVEAHYDRLAYEKQLRIDKGIDRVLMPGQEDPNNSNNNGDDIDDDDNDGGDDGDHNNDNNDNRNSSSMNGTQP